MFRAVSWDPEKREWTRANRGLDFARTLAVFRGPKYTRIDARRDYGELRMVTVGFLDGRMVVVAWTPRVPARHIISMRKANDREQKSYARWLPPEAG